jgi:glycosyltransferase involved in cell wall biosynthesis
MKKKVLIHSLIFSPDGVSTAYLYNDIALELQRQGYEVVVLTTTPHYNVVGEQLKEQPLHWKLWGLCKESNFRGIRVLHVPQRKFKSTLLRLIGFVYWHVVSFFIGLAQRNVDVILSPSPPLTIGLLNIGLARLKGCRVVYNVQEIYPDILKKKEGVVYNALRRMERFVYRRSDAVTTIDQVFYDTIVGRFDNPAKLHIIPNFVDTELYHPIPAEALTLDETLFPRRDSIKLLYAGNIGFAQDWEPLVELALKTKECNIEYFVIGEGVMKSWLEEQKAKHQLAKLHIIPYQPRNLVPQIIAYSDLQFIFMHPDMEKQGFPSKVYTIMACKKPLLVCSGKDTPIVSFLAPLHCGELVTTHDLNEKVGQMARWLASVSKEELQAMGERGFDEVNRCYTKEIVTRQYVALIDSLVK